MSLKGYCERIFFNENAWIKRGNIGLGGFMEMVLTITSCQKNIGDVGCLSSKSDKTEFIFLFKIILIIIL